MSQQHQVRLTPQLHQQIVATIRAGGYPHIAAQASGLPTGLLDDWLRRGLRRTGRALYRSLARAVVQAHAQARLKAEVQVLQEMPRIWLEHGPGRDRADNQGWSASVPSASANSGADDGRMSQETCALLRLIPELLAPYPDARQHVARELQQCELRPAA